MSSFEFNKLFGAVLCALITIWLAWFAVNTLFKPKDLQKDAVTIEGASDEHGQNEIVDAGPQIPEPIMALIATADIEKGAKISKACAACHSFEKGGANKQGPALWGIVGRAKASHEGFSYSEGIKAKGGNWDYDSLNNFLWKPKKYITDTKMSFIGLKKPEERAALIAWLRNQADSAHALPSESEIKAESEAAAPVAEPAEDPAEEAAAPATDTPTNGVAKTHAFVENTGKETQTETKDNTNSAVANGDKKK